MLPSVNIRYNRRNYQPNIYSIVVASSGANKNLIGYGIRLHKHYCEYWEKQSLKIEKEYKKALRAYALSLQAARRPTKLCSTCCLLLMRAWSPRPRGTLPAMRRGLLNLAVIRC